MSATPPNLIQKSRIALALTLIVLCVTVTHFAFELGPRWATEILAIFTLALGSCAYFLKLTEQKNHYRSQKDYFSSLVQHSADGVIVINQKSKILLANSAACDIFGYNSTELLNHSIDLLIPNSERRHHQTLVANSELGHTKKLNRMREIWGVRQDGTEVPLEISISPILVNGEKQFVGIVRDISERRAEQAQLRQREQSLQTITRVSPVGILKLDERSRCLFVNEHWCELIEAQPESSYKTDWMNFIHPGDMPSVQSMLLQLISEQVTRLSREVRVGPIGQWTRVALMTCTAESNADGLSIVAALTDVTELKQIERKMLSQSQMLSTLNQVTNTFLVKHDVQACFSEILNIVLEISESEFGFLSEYMNREQDAKFMRAYAISDISWDEDSRAFYKQYEEKSYMDFYAMDNLFGHVLKTGETVLSNSPLTDSRAGGFPEKHKAMNSFLGLPLTAGDEVLGMIAIANRPGGYDQEVVDFLEPFRVALSSMIRSMRAERERNSALHDLKTAKDEAEQANRSKSMFLATMSHEIRTPMNGIIGMTELLSSSRLDESQSQYIQTIGRSAESLLTIINDVLDISKLEAGKLELFPEPFNLPTLIDDVAKLLQAVAEAKGLKVEINVPEGFYPYYLGDAIRLRQVILNLLGNAIKFTDKGHVEIGARNADSGDHLEIYVQDTGVGISKDQQNKLFGIFEQVDQSASRRFEGTGLGLAICKRLVQKMGGNIQVNSELGIGSRFTVHLHLPRADKPVEKQITHCGEVTDWGDRKLLIVDDNPTNQQVMELLLSQLGFKVDLANNGIEAVRAVTTKPYDLVFMDCQMPEMDGYQATRSIRKQSASKVHLKGLPIVALTANAMAEDRAKCLEAGMDDYLAKPVRRADILACLKLHLDVNPNVSVTTPAEEVEIKEAEEKASASNESIAQPDAEFDSEITELPWVDLDHLADIVGNDAETLVMVLENYRRFLEKDLTTLREAFESDDIDAQKSVLHRMKGGASGSGALRLSATLASVEVILKRGEVISHKDKINAMKAVSSTLKATESDNLALLVKAQQDTQASQ